MEIADFHVRDLIVDIQLKIGEVDILALWRDVSYGNRNRLEGFADVIRAKAQKGAGRFSAPR